MPRPARLKNVVIFGGDVAGVAHFPRSLDLVWDTLSFAVADGDIAGYLLSGGQDVGAGNFAVAQAYPSEFFTFLY